MEKLKDETKENIILVIGNGFDIANGYKTRYSDFLDFTKEIIENENLSDRRKVEYRKIATHNSFIQHFYKYNRQLNTWVDVEREMYNVVQAIEEVFNDNSKHFVVDQFDRFTEIVDVDGYQKQVLYEFNLITDSNPAGKQIVNKKMYSNHYRIDWNNLNKFLELQLRDLKKLLMIYLKDFMPKLGGGEYIYNQLDRIRPNHIITFNYTDYYESYGYDYEDVYHVHGDLKNESIVLGYEDDNPKDLRYVKFKKYFQIIQNRIKPLDTSIFNKYSSGLKIKSITHIYGLALDKTDQEQIIKIFDNSDEIIIYYLDNADYEQKIVNLIDIFSKDRITKDIYDEKINFVEIHNSK